MDPLDVLEKRIEALELQILPKNRNSHLLQNQTVSDLLLQTQTMVNSALSCREAITSILQHMNTINEYLDPTNGENELEIEAKRQYFLELYPELKDTVKLISTFESLTPYSDATNLIKVVDMTDKLQKLVVTNVNICEESRRITNDVVLSMLKYTEITSSIKVLFAQLDRAISDLEVALLPKFVTEE